MAWAEAWAVLSIIVGTQRTHCLNKLLVYQHHVLRVLSILPSARILDQLLTTLMLWMLTWGKRACLGVVPNKSGGHRLIMHLSAPEAGPTRTHALVMSLALSLLF